VVACGATAYPRPVQPDSEDDAWRSIVDNYGDRADLGPEEAPAPAAERDHGREDPDDDEAWDEDRYVPPPPPPLPHVTPDRLAAWTGVFGAPTVLLVALLVGIHLPAWLGWLLVASFVGGFVYLVVQMPRGPRDPGDDGARL
jgi:hypothetical protein